MLFRDKIIVTIAAAAVAIALQFVSRDVPTPSNSWRLGRNDPVRRLLMREDGTLRRWTIEGITLWIALGIVVIWLFL